MSGRVLILFERDSSALYGDDEAYILKYTCRGLNNITCTIFTSDTIASKLSSAKQITGSQFPLSLQYLVAIQEKEY